MPPARSNPPRLPPVAPALASAGMSTAIKQPPPMQPPARPSTLDDALLRELEVTFDDIPPKQPEKPAEMTLDDEMTKLLGELSNKKQ